MGDDISMPVHSHDGRRVVLVGVGLCKDFSSCHLALNLLGVDNWCCAIRTCQCLDVCCHVSSCGSQDVLVSVGSMSLEHMYYK